MDIKKESLWTVLAYLADKRIVGMSEVNSWNSENIVGEMGGILQDDGRVSRREHGKNII